MKDKYNIDSDSDNDGHDIEPHGGNSNDGHNISG
jgi:hypothetical protein